jgi:hypothetical protein
VSSVAANSSLRLRARSSDSNGLRQATRFSPGEAAEILGRVAFIEQRELRGATFQLLIATEAVQFTSISAKIGKSYL